MKERGAVVFKMDMDRKPMQMEVRTTLFSYRLIKANINHLIVMGAVGLLETPVTPIN